MTGAPDVSDHHGGNAGRLHEYWVHGEGAAKIAWGTPGDFDRCVARLGKYIHDPEGYCNLAHKAALGIYPATHAAEIKKASRAVTAGPDYDADGLDDSWDGVEGDDAFPDLTGLSLDHFEQAEQDLGMVPPAQDASRAAMPAGSGARFKSLSAKLGAKGAADPDALAAWIGRKKYGREGFKKLAAAGRRRHSAGRAETAAFDGFLVRSFPVEDMHILRSGDGRTVEAYAAVFDTEAEIRDSQGHYLEVIDRSAFNRAVDKARPQGSRNYWLTRCFYNHGMTLHGTPSERFSVPLGVTQDIRVESRGLLTVTRYNPTPLAEEILEAVKSGSITGQSFTGRIVRSDPNIGPGQSYRARRGADLPVVRRLELGLSEYGPTPVPYYADAEIVGVRAALASFGTAASRHEAEDHDPGPSPDEDDLAAEDGQSADEPLAGHSALVSRMHSLAVTRSVSWKRGTGSGKP